MFCLKRKQEKISRFGGFRIRENMSRTCYKFKYVANMHGDEVVGRQMVIYLAHYLLQNYRRDRRVKQLVDNTEIYLMPSMNPDGYTASKPGCNTFGGN